MATNTYTALRTYTVTGSNLLGTTGVTLDLTGITGYTDLRIVFSGKLTAAAISLIRFNGDTASNYSCTIVGGDGATAASTRQSNGTASYLSAYGHFNANQESMTIDIFNYTNTTTYKTFLFRTNNGGGLGLDAGVGIWRKTPEAITSIQIFLDRAEYYVVGSTFTVYGIAVEPTAASTATPPITGYSLWLDSSDDASFTYSTGTTVSQWNDKSGNARHFVQSTAGNRPQRISNVRQNNYPVVQFQNSWMYNTGFNWSNSAFTVFSVIRYDLSATNYSGIFGANASSGPSLAINSDDAYATFKVGVAPYTYNLYPTGLANADIAVWKSAGVSSGSMTTSFYKNGTAASSTTSMSGLTTGTGAVIGASTASGSDPSPSGQYIYYCEVLVYPSQLSDSDRTSVESYLKTKWGIQ